MSERRDWRAWARWALMAEGLILLLAVAGPGYRYAFRPGGDTGLFARLVIEDPTFLEALLVNLVALHLVIGGLWLAAWIVARRRGEGPDS